MKIVFISDWFAENVGYSENLLTKATASLGHEVHLVTSNVQPYFDTPFYKKTYEPFIGPPIQPCGIKAFDGYMLHRLPHKKVRGKLLIKGLLPKLHALRPEIVQTFDVQCLSTYEAALAQPFLGYKLFLETHLHASVFEEKQFGWKKFLRHTKNMVLGRYVSFRSQACYPISIDTAEIAVQFFGIQQEKIRICSLGTDTFLFRPVEDKASQDARALTRAKLGFAEDDIVCIYTGRFTEGKKPLCLAQAIAELANQESKYRGLFLGSGPQEEDIRKCTGCVIHPFVPLPELHPFYQAADIGVWPAQESTSQLDAAACGLPLILSNQVTVRERVDGNGLVYEEGNPLDLAYKIRILSHPQVRQYLGAQGAKKIAEQYSWVRIAQERVRDYEAAL